jgi:hypothetical protein
MTSYSRKHHHAATVIQRDWRAILKKRQHAAAVIQRNLAGFLAQRRSVAYTAFQLAAVMGDLLVDIEEYFDLMDEGRVIVQINGNFADPLEGHSLIYYQYYSYDLRFSKAATDPADAFSRAGMSRQMSEFLHGTLKKKMAAQLKERDPDARLDEATVPYYPAGTRSGIARHKLDEDTMPGSVAKLVLKGRLFALHEKYSKNLENAYHLELSQFRNAARSYGLHCNCNTFVANMLNRLRSLTPG